MAKNKNLHMAMGDAAMSNTLYKFSPPSCFAFTKTLLSAPEAPARSANNWLSTHHAHLRFSKELDLEPDHYAC